MAVNGVCLTAAALAERSFTADLSAETQRRTTLGALRAGAKVNLERPVSASDPLGGHVVLGHVDAVGRVRRVRPGAAGHELLVAAPPEIMALLVPKGSIAVDGVSLTAGALERDGFWLHLIPETLARTTLGTRTVGDEVFDDEAFNLQFLLGYAWGVGGKMKDRDADGVIDCRDGCDGTPAGAATDAKGCPSDEDIDGVLDGLDKCPGTLKGCKIDAVGCPIDSDGDGVIDCLDKWPGTTRGVKVGAVGCPVDSDGDGVFAWPSSSRRVPNRNRHALAPLVPMS